MADGAKAHRAGREAFDDFAGRFHFIQRNSRIGIFEFHQTANRQQAFALFIHAFGEFFVILMIVAAHSMLQLRDILRCPGVLFTALAILIDTAYIQHALIQRIIAIGLRVAAHGFLTNFGQAHAFDCGGCAGQIFVDELR